MAGLELAVLDVIVQIGGQLALRDVVAGELARIRIEGRQLDVAGSSG